MSHRVLEWAWRQDLPSNQKFILVALSETANDDGICWPSVPTVAAKCNVSIRTVQRIMRILVARRKIVSEPRYRGNGSCSSNCYKLLLDGGDKLSPPPDSSVRPPRQGCQGPHDTGVTPRTTSRTKKEPPPQKVQAKPIAPVEMVSAKGGGDFFELEYPKGLSASEREEVRKKLAALSVEMAQQLLDELAGRMAAGTIRVSPLAYLRGLIDRAYQGDFTPEVALKVAEKRKCRRQTEAARERSESAHKKAVADRIATVTADSNPLVRKLTNIRRKVKNSGGKAE